MVVVVVVAVVVAVAEVVVVVVAVPVVLVVLVVLVVVVVVVVVVIVVGGIIRTATLSELGQQRAWKRSCAVPCVRVIKTALDPKSDPSDPPSLF